jgi:hypothetical protein
MLICEKCLKNFNAWGISFSYGKCEICGKIEPCCDIPSKYFEEKMKNQTP